MCQVNVDPHYNVPRNQNFIGLKLNLFKLQLPNKIFKTFQVNRTNILLNDFTQIVHVPTYDYDLDYTLKHLYL